MDPKLHSALRAIDRLSERALPGQMHGWLRSQAIRYLIGGQRPSLPRRALKTPDVLSLNISAPSVDAPMNQEACELVMCCAFSGRHRVLRRVIEESLAAQAGRAVRWMLAGSTTEDHAFIEAMAKTTGRVAGFVCENRPLGRKWRHCMILAGRYYDAEIYGITGSDDIISSRLIDHVIGRFRSDSASGLGWNYLPSLYAGMEWLVAITDDSQASFPQIIRCCYGYDAVFQPLGAGRFYTRPFLREVDFEIFDSRLERLLDDRGYFEVCDRGKLIDYYTIEDGPIISVKGNWPQLNKVDDILSAPQLDPREFSFEGCSLIRNSVSLSTFRYLFKPSRIGAQFNFSSPPLGARYAS